MASALSKHSTSHASTIFGGIFKCSIKQTLKQGSGGTSSKLTIVHVSDFARDKKLIATRQPFDREKATKKSLCAVLSNAVALPANALHSQSGILVFGVDYTTR